jgi:AraC family transcriptional regulator
MVEKKSEFDIIEGIHGAVQRKTDAPDVVMTETQYSPNTRLSPHTHRQGCFGFILQGEYSEAYRLLELNQSPSQGGWFRPPLIEHQNSVGKQGARALFLEVSDRWLNHVKEYSPILVQPAQLRSGPIDRLAAAICRQWQEGPCGAHLAVEGLLYEIAAEICRQGAESHEHRPKWLDDVLELMRARFSEPLRLSDMAHEVGYHPVHVARVFRQHYGMTMVEFIRQLRIDFARERLQRSDMALVDIGLSAGFPSQAYFSTTFKRETGLTPGQYRRGRGKRP